MTPISALIAPLLFSLGMAQEPPITVRGYPWAPFISPMGEPFRPPTTGEAPIARWFTQADRNGDGALTNDEFQADADRFFTRLDDNRDGQIDPQEIQAYEYDVAPDVQVNSQWKRARDEAAPQTAPKPDSARSKFTGDWTRKGGEDQHDGYQINGLQGAARYGLLNIPQPVSSADADFNRLVTMAEFRQAAAYRFKLLDTPGLGRVTLAELEERLPMRPKGKRAKRRKGATDARIGLPLPEGN